jgi:hypothetical protein
MFVSMEYIVQTKIDAFPWIYNTVFKFLSYKINWYIKILARCVLELLFMCAFKSYLFPEAKLWNMWVAFVTRSSFHEHHLCKAPDNDNLGSLYIWSFYFSILPSHISSLSSLRGLHSIVHQLPSQQVKCVAGRSCHSLLVEQSLLHAEFFMELSFPIFLGKHSP